MLQVYQLVIWLDGPTNFLHYGRMDSTAAFPDLGDITRVSTSSVVAARLIDLISSGALKPGTALPPERDLASSLAVSRSTLREAIHELTLKGFITRKQGSGSFVSIPSDSSNELLSDLGASEREAREVVDFRLVFEPHMAQLAALRATDSDLVRLSDLCDYDPVAADPDESMDLDHRFHQAIADATQNRLLMTLCATSSGWIAELRSRSHATGENRRASLEGHRKIVEAIRARDSAAAEAAMHEHIMLVGFLD